MNAKNLLLPSLLVAGLALATTPSFAQNDKPMDQTQTGQPDQMQQGNAPADQTQGDPSNGTQAAQPAKPMRHHRTSARSRSNDDNYHADAMDVAPGGGTYSRADVAAEPSDRMSHPVVGEAKAPSDVAQGSLADVDQKEREITAKLNEQQASGMPEQTAQSPNQ